MTISIYSLCELCAVFFLRALCLQDFVNVLAVIPQRTLSLTGLIYADSHYKKIL